MYESISNSSEFACVTEFSGTFFLLPEVNKLDSKLPLLEDVSNGMICLIKLIASGFDNMLVIHSGVLPRAGGINSTSAAFPLLEEFIRTRL